MKRSDSATPSPPLSPAEPVTPPTKKSKTTKTPTPKSARSAKSTSSPQANGTWDPQKRGLFMDEIIAAGYKSADLDAIASKLELSKRQLIDQLVPNRGGNLRGKAVKAVSGKQ